MFQDPSLSYETILQDFENQCTGIKHKKCDFCHSVSIHLRMSPITCHGNICADCYQRKVYEDVTKIPLLPIWYSDNNTPQYHVPKELSVLREAEKLLISLVSVYVPVQHLSMGQLGCKGHVCCFEKDLCDLCNVLPRLPSNIAVVRVIRKFQNDDKEITTKAFSVRKQQVLDALRWLCHYNPLYKNVIIEPHNLDWIGDDLEKELPGNVTVEEHSCQLHSSKDLGPSPKQTTEETEKEEYFEECSGSIQQFMTDKNMSKKNKLVSLEINNAIQSNSKKMKKTAVMNWPYCDTEAMSEFGDNINLFCKAFPWLFPGGIGDFSQIPNKSESPEKWSQRMLWYEDGRFAKDKIWCFYTLNVSNRKRNQSAGGFFVNSWYKEGQASQETIKNDLLNGNMKWLDKITYYCKSVKGSTAYWRQKRDEVYSWINYHVSVGNGPPNFFITLSCAEYHWPDIKRLITERFFLAGLPLPNLEKSYIQLVNDYTLIVQEYFQKKVKLWLDTVGKHIFKITHYWLRYEFAASRGQIHAHMLAISDHKKAFQVGNTYAGMNRNKQAEFLAEWTSKTLGFTSSLPVNKDSIDSTQVNNPAKKRYGDVRDLTQDLAECMLFFAQHGCSDYCMRKRTRTEKSEESASKRRRVCRTGAGIEDTAGLADTPGFKLRTHPEIVHDVRNFFRLELPRNDRRTTLVSAPMLQSWRANCDCQVILYESNFENPDLIEIARITDYIVAYTCKGNESVQHEKDEMKRYLLSMPSDTTSLTDKQESTRIARQVMNKVLKEKIMSKQECMVHLAQLPLFECSETIEVVSVSGSYRLDSSPAKGSSFFHRYANRTQHLEMSLHEYFLHEKSSTDYLRSKNIIPYYVGGRCIPQFPPTEEYAKSVFIIYVPWHKTFIQENRNFVSEFFEFLKCESCPREVKIPFERIRNRVLTKTVHVEPKNQHENIDYSTFSYSLDSENQDLIEAISTFQTENDEPDLHSKFYTGKDYPWDVPHIQLPEDCDATTWIDRMIETHEMQPTEKSNPYALPMRNDGTFFDIKNVFNDQRQIISYVLAHVKEWIETEYTKHILPKPLRMTIAGVAGSGKSTMINTLVSIMRSFFQSKESVKVTAPTGAAAYNAGGVTNHHGFGMKMKTSITDLSDKTTRDLRNDLAGLVCLIIDERSMVSSKILAAMEFRARQCANNGRCQSNDWGNIPIILLVGDDFQLPSIDSGMIYSMEQKYVEEICGQSYHNKKPIDQQCGEDLFRQIGRDVMFLDGSKRQNKDQKHFREILEKVRCEPNGKNMTEEDAKYLNSFHLQRSDFTADQIATLTHDPETLFLFALHAGKDACNEKMLYRDHSKHNPVAIIKTISKNKHGAVISNTSRHFGRESNVQNRTMFCRNAKVHLYGKNIKPEWGLFNGAQGVVKDIVFASGHSPNTNDQPIYVLVDFPQYKGPSFLVDHPTFVPIVPMQHFCIKHCCSKTFIPLQLSYARTIHTFQGSSVGKTPPGYPQNAIKRIICDPGPREFEMKSPGLFYTLLSRATTMSEENDDRMLSAIFFTGQNMDISRVLGLTTTKNGKTPRKVALRNLWVEELNRHIHEYILNSLEMENLLSFFLDNTFSSPALLEKFYK